MDDRAARAALADAIEDAFRRSGGNGPRWFQKLTDASNLPRARARYFSEQLFPDGPIGDLEKLCRLSKVALDHLEQDATLPGTSELDRLRKTLANELRAELGRFMRL